MGVNPLDHSSPHGIFVNIFQQRGQIDVIQDKIGFKSPLKDVSHLFVPSIEIFRILNMDLAEHRPERMFPAMDEQMQMIGHQAKSAKGRTVSVNPFGHETQIRSTVVIVQK